MGRIMTTYGKQVCWLSLGFLFFAMISHAQTPALEGPGQEQGPPTAGRWRVTNDGPGLPLLGKITTINKGLLELAKMDGTTVSVKLTDKTEYRKDRQSAKLADFKVGDMVFVRGEENADHSVTAQIVGGRTGGGPEGGRGFGGGAGFELGKDYVLGEVKSVDAPKLTVLNLMLFSPEQWKQMEEMRKSAGIGLAGNGAGISRPATAPKSNPPQP